KVILTGFSQGGSLAYEAALSHPELFTGLIPVAGRYTAAEGSAAGKITDKPAAKLSKVFIMVGAEDRATVLDTSKQAVKDFEAAGCKVQLATYQGVGHTYPENRVEEQVKAIKFILGG
ncbi:MAG: dienelactone hydrolase family protein, partial [Phycisphaerales bacterium]